MTSILDLYFRDRSLIFRYPRLNRFLDVCLLAFLFVAFLFLTLIAADKIYCVIVASGWSWNELGSAAVTVMAAHTLQKIVIFTARYVVNPTPENLLMLARYWLAVLWRLMRVRK